MRSKYGSFSPKNVGNFFVKCQVSMATKFEGEPLKIDQFFCGFPYPFSILIKNWDRSHGQNKFFAFCQTGVKRYVSRVPG